MKKIIVLLIICFPYMGFGQKLSLSTNLLEYANLGTLNMEASLALAQKFSVNTSVKYNPFTYNKGDVEAQFQNRQRAFSLGVRYWPWHVYSDWWLGIKAQTQEYNKGGMDFMGNASEQNSLKTEEGDRYGLGLSAGYTLLINENLNLDFGLGLWGGVTKYYVYSCPNCGLLEKKGMKKFIKPNDVLISLVYVF